MSTQPPETLAEGILRRVGELDLAYRRMHALLHEAERENERLRTELAAIAADSPHTETRDRARKALNP